MLYLSRRTKLTEQLNSILKEKVIVKGFETEVWTAINLINNVLDKEFKNFEEVKEIRQQVLGSLQIEINKMEIKKANSIPFKSFLERINQIRTELDMFLGDVQFGMISQKVEFEMATNKQKTEVSKELTLTERLQNIDLNTRRNHRAIKEFEQDWQVEFKTLQENTTQQQPEVSQKKRTNILFFWKK